MNFLEAMSKTKEHEGIRIKSWDKGKILIQFNKKKNRNRENDTFMFFTDDLKHDMVAQLPKKDYLSNDWEVVPSRDTLSDRYKYNDIDDIGFYDEEHVWQFILEFVDILCHADNTGDLNDEYIEKQAKEVFGKEYIQYLEGIDKEESK